MQNANCKLQNESSPWPHRWAIALTCATFPLLWVGGLVTTTKAGMAVPDWPSTFGYNLFLYPLLTWLAGPWDVFVEHGHRLFASAVGLITIGLLVTLWQCDDRAWVRWLGVFALVLVVFQGILGGLRVRLDERTLAMIHGFTGPAFFALATSLAVFTSVRWRGIYQESMLSSDAYSLNVCRLAVLTAVLAYSQIVLGAFLRHMPVMAEPATFVFALRSHLVMAGILSISVLLLVGSVFRHAQSFTRLRRLAAILGILLLAQVSLGAGTWIVKYSVPKWAEAWLPATWNNGAIVDGGLLQTHVVTGHVAIGSLLMAASLALALYSLRFLGRPAVLAAPSLQRRGAAI